MHPRALAAPANRGILLDVVVFVLNLLLMRRLAAELVRLVRGASAGDASARLALTLVFAAMFVLPAAGAVLKRWHFHQRRGRAGEDATERLGCLANPALYLSVSLVVGMTAGVLAAQQLFGDDFAERAGTFLPLVFGVAVLSIVQTALVYRYFSPPRQPPRSAFLRGERSAALGDACIFLNMILYQVLWNIAAGAPAGRMDDLEGVAGRIFFLWFLSLLLYLPPRIFYLADDARRRAAWITIPLATSPILLRVLGIL